MFAVAFYINYDEDNFFKHAIIDRVCLCPVGCQKKILDS